MIAPEDEITAAFTEVRPRLFGIAYRVLGSVGEAEDVVQEAWLRWQRYDHDSVRDASAFLSTVTTRLAVNETRTARVRHQRAIGPWTPEPADPGPDPLLAAERADAVGHALQQLLEKLSPVQRAAYVLREAFDYPYGEIADLVRLSEPNVRQLVSRARTRLTDERRRPVRRGQRQRLQAAFLAAARAGDFASLEELFVDEMTG